MTGQHKKQLCLIGALMVAGIVLFLGGWVVASRMFEIELVKTCRFAGFTVMLLLFTCFLLPLFLNHPHEQKLRGWVVFWFVGSLGFDLFWEIPLWTIPVIHEAAHTAENLPWAIFWWAYTLCDTHYADVTPFMITMEIWWLLGNLIGLAGLLKLRSGNDQLGYLLLGICGALQCYNVTLYLVMSVYVDQYEPIARDFLGQVIYWGFNGFWTLASGCASIVAFKLFLADSRNQ